MAILIDGYNLLHGSGILGRGVGPGSLERSRTALLNFLAESLEESELPRTVVVFDARSAPPGLPRVVMHRGMTVRFAEPGSDADDVIEQLIKADSAPRRLTVVSSDHRLHRAARRRKARPVDSDEWYADVLRKRIAGVRRKSPSLKPTDLPGDGEVRFWLRQFGLEDIETPATHSTSTDAASSDAASDLTSADDDRPRQSPANPFPPGYAEDIREEDV
jgi:predicted RNA-binding protein with PIN domain